MHYGYIGLGNLGAACAGCLVKDGFQVTVYDLNPKAGRSAGRAWEPRSGEQRRGIGGLG